MNRLELTQKLKKIGISDAIYNLYGKEDSGIILSHNTLSINRKWRIDNIDDRGNKLETIFFRTENEACEYIYQRMIKFKWIMDNGHIHPNERPKSSEISGFEVTDEGKINAILTDGKRWPGH
jgi:hypothetical protein